MFDQDFFWNLFLNTGRIDAYLLLKKESIAPKNQPPQKEES